MTTLALFSLSLAVALGMPPFALGVEQSPLLGDWVPVHGHVVVEEAAPQVRSGSEEKKEEMSPVPTDRNYRVEVLEIQEKPQVSEEQEGEVNAEFEKEPDVKEDLEAEVEPEVHLNPEVMVNVNADAEPAVEMAQMNLEGNLETGQDFKERHIDMEGKYGMGEPIMELEPLDEDNVPFSEVENSLMAPFQNHNSVNLTLPNPNDFGYFSNEEPIMELEPEEVGQQVMPEASTVEEGPDLDIMGQQTPSLGEYFMGEKQASVGLPEMEAGPDEGQNGVALKKQPLRKGVKNPEERRSSPNQDHQGKSHCPGVLLQGTCYQFFTGPKTASDAEFFCQEHFTAGHLASITSQRIHREVMDMILQQNRFLTRTWIGGLQYLKTGRFIWLDGSHWGYADWLQWEPNNTSNLEDCVELLPQGNGKFNDFTCWEAQPFLCSYPFQ